MSFCSDPWREGWVESSNFMKEYHGNQVNAWRTPPFQNKQETNPISDRNYWSKVENQTQKRHTRGWAPTIGSHLIVQESIPFSDNDIFLKTRNCFRKFHPSEFLWEKKELENNFHRTLLTSPQKKETSHLRPRP